MEDDLQAVTVGIIQDVLVELHGRLFVTSEEIHLNALHADALQPRHLLLSCGCRAQTLAGRLRGIVLVAFCRAADVFIHWRGVCGASFS